MQRDGVELFMYGIPASEEMISMSSTIQNSLIQEDLMVMRRWRMTTRTMAKTRARVRTRKSRRSRRRSRRTRMTRMTMGNGKLANQMNVADQINFYLKYISNNPPQL